MTTEYNIFSRHRQKSRAMEFAAAGTDGLVVKLVASDLADNRRVMKFESFRFSAFSEEEETLFFGGSTVLRIKGIIQRTQGK